ncbi:MAG TPA: DMT family transporter [Novosphingobium sp.]
MPPGYGEGMAVARLALPGARQRYLPLAATLLGIALYSLMDALMKRASIVCGVYPALFGRSLAGTVLLIPAWRVLTGGRLPAPGLLGLHLLRGLLATGAAWTFFYGIVRTPIAQGIAMSFIAPLVALALAGLLLGEAIRRQAILAALVAMLGVLVIAAGRLGAAAPGPEALSGIVAILVSALLYAWNLVLQRQLAQRASPVEVALSQNIVIAMVLLLGAPVVAQVQVLAGGHPDASAATLLVPARAALSDILAAAVVASSSLMLLAWAYARAEAQALVPMEYSAFLWAAVMGWWWFGEMVTGWTLAGLVLILAGVWWGTRASVPSLPQN